MLDYFFTQTLVLCGVRVKPHKDLCSIVYPVSNLGAAQQLKHIDPSLRSMATEYISQRHGLKEHGDNAVECILCESADGRLCNIHDRFTTGQSLFRLSSLVVAMLKEYGINKLWTNVVEPQTGKHWVFSCVMASVRTLSPPHHRFRVVPSVS